MVEPAYDPVAGVWFTSSGVEAPSIRALLAKIPGATMRAYYPGGYGVSATMRGYVVNAMRHQSAGPAATRAVRPNTGWKSLTAVEPRPGRSRGGSSKRYDYDGVLALWLEGLSASEIAGRKGVTASAVSALIQNARKNKDPRAVMAGDPRRGAGRCA